MRLPIFIFAIFSTFLFSVSFVFAVTPSPPAGVAITLSEVSACNTGGDWVEVYNPGDTPIDIGGWKIGKNKSGTASMSGIIAPKTYQKIDFSSSFANTGFAVTLIEPSSNDPIETFPSIYKTNKDDSSLQTCPKINTDSSWIKEGEDWKLTTTLTPGSANVYVATTTPTPTPMKTSTPSPTNTTTSTPSPTTTTTASTPGTQPTSITLSEVYACQNDGEKEWVELANSANTSVTLSDWKLMDDDHNEQPISSLTISAKGYAAVEITKYSKGMLTNSGDVINVYDATGKKIDSYTYKSCTKGSSWAKIGGSWEETTTLSKGAANSQPSVRLASAQPDGDGGDVKVASLSGAEESSASGYVLGTQTENTGTFTGTSASIPAEKRAETNWIAIELIGTGIVILLGSSGYYGWLRWKKKKTV